MSLKAVIPMATITSLRGEYPGGQFKRQHVKTECCLFDVASNSLPTPRSVVHPSYQATACN